ncbi:outer membrane protein OmpA-like peptidoglycan-associated protein [Hasllibacter halocynthiae]|uniref:Outer membrane protein OmpA-like peptidoglycan-associated protein n=1 Tax=Hasllibacter halocynthiae TaxID=595589 RepID=A0A2T0X3M4_9RHOB|nr:OmpA family protein [Hasllibacter halocynthiae]PRY93553.1 outer membrane protein OmpA-like peptidoglycan-associated protein [Hasllibacter halocynthiae]
MTKTFLTLSGAALALTACTVAPTGQPLDSNTQRGAATGALVGAVIGAAQADSGDRLRDAAIGAVVGAGTGGVAGSVLDRQEAALRQSLSGGVGIVNTGDRLVVTLPQDILFRTDSAQLTGSLQRDLTTLARSMNQFPSTRVQVIGHADNTGSAAYNRDLSSRRAQAVAQQLVAGGVAPQRIRTVGAGEDQPIASNLTPEGRQQNRRVEIVITER